MTKSLRITLIIAFSILIFEIAVAEGYRIFVNNYEEVVHREEATGRPYTPPHAR